MFKKVLVANRGEVALRIMRTCEELGIRTVAVFSEADRLSPHVLYADEAYLLGPPSPRQSYLNISAIIDVAKRCGAGAIHPGYGFLAENPDFAAACDKAGIEFLGPTAEMIRRMGNKLEARRIMQKAGVPIVPGATVAAMDLAMTKQLATQIGYPVVVKPADGGGGKGMHVVHDEAHLESELRLAASEAASAFGSSTVYLEKYLKPVRHVEVQLVRDRHGNAIHLGERECSVQRRHQKIIEESPSLAVDPALRKRLTEAGIAAVEAVDYHGVGTCEFLLDQDKNFYFLEMNTRLQVEHSITEQVTGLDLVEAQFQVASGQPLDIKQDDVRFYGWAIECRISAEDPYNNFMPSPGLIELLYEPGGPGIRVDTGVSKGYEVPVFYDPMIAKVITWGRTRDQALRRMRRALRHYKILGIHNNIPFLLAIIHHKKFIEGDLDTSFLDENADLFEQQPKANAELAAVVAAVLDYQGRRKSGARKAANGNGAGNGRAWKTQGQLAEWDRPWR